MSTKRPAKKAPAEAGAYRAPSSYQVGAVKVLMPDSPLTPAAQPVEPGIPRLVTEAKYRENAEAQQRALLALADKVQEGVEALSAHERTWVAGAVRAYASQIYLKAPGRGAAPKIDPLSLVARYLELRRKEGMNKTGAIAELEEELGVSDRAIKDVLKKYSAQVDMWEALMWGS